MKSTCDLCPRPATRHYHPGDHARCGLHEYDDRASVSSHEHLCTRPRSALSAPGGVVGPEPSAPLTRRPPPLAPGVADLDEVRGLLEQAPTVIPPADERCPRCSRILIAAPCGCLSAAQRWVAMQTEADALWRGMSSAEHVEAVRLRAAGRVTVQGPAEAQSCT